MESTSWNVPAHKEDIERTQKCEFFTDKRNKPITVLSKF